VLLQLDNDLGSVEPIYQWPEAQRLFGNLSRTTVWRRVRAGDIPKPVHISPGRIGWLHSDIVAWQAERAAAARQPPDTAELRAAYGM
jgi:prophage regulatory protein